MKTRYAYLKIIGLTFIIITYGFIVAVYLPRIENWEREKSIELIQKSNYESNPDIQLAYLQQATILNPNEENIILTGIKAGETEHWNIAEIYLKQVKTAEGLSRLAEIYYQKNDYQNARKYNYKALEIEEKSYNWLNISKSYLKEANIKEANNALKKATTENSSEINFYLALIAAIEDDNQQFNKYYELTNDCFREKLTNFNISSAPSTKTNLIIEGLKSEGYPQLAYSIMIDKEKLGELDRDGYISLANEEYKRKEYQKSYQYLLQAKAKDNYYPQTYQHLIEVVTKLGYEQEKIEYQNFLKVLSW